KFEDDEPPRLPVAFERLHRSAPRQVAPSVLEDGCRDALAVLVVSGGVLDLDVGHDLNGHGSSSILSRAPYGPAVTRSLRPVGRRHGSPGSGPGARDPRRRSPIFDRCFDAERSTVGREASAVVCLVATRTCRLGAVRTPSTRGPVGSRVTPR